MTQENSGASAPKSPTSGNAVNMQSAPRDCPKTIAADLRVASATKQAVRVTHDGKPANVLIFTDERGTVAVLYDPGNCRILITTYSN